jgi:hypothetical protein
METMTMEQLEAVNDSDALCACGANPRAAESLDGWFIDSVVTPKGRLAQACCPNCW